MDWAGDPAIEASWAPGFTCIVFPFISISCAMILFVVG